LRSWSCLKGARPSTNLLASNAWAGTVVPGPGVDDYLLLVAVGQWWPLPAVTTTALERETSRRTDSSTCGGVMML